MKTTLALFAACLLAGLSQSSDAQAGTGNRYQVTTRMEMPGMPFAPPPQTSEVCGPKEGGAQSIVPHHDNCTISDYHVNGNTYSFKMQCSGRDAMSGTGEFTMLGAAGYHGKITAEMQGMQMIMNFDGKKIGDCDYATESPQAKVGAMIAKTCDQLLTQPAEALAMSSASFANGGTCANQRAAYCGKLMSLGDDPKTLRGLESYSSQVRSSGVPGSDPWDAFKVCGSGRAAVLAKACPKAMATADYDYVAAFCPANLMADACNKADPVKGGDFLVDHCPARAQSIAAAKCAGRDYTALMGSPYAGFCGKMAGQRMGRTPKNH
jgi:hypothetical protein